MTEQTERVALVTGAGSGIGAATARLLAREGWAVAVADVRAAEAERVAADVRASGGQALAVALDVTQRDQWSAAVATVEDAWAPVTALVNNAGRTRDRSLLKMSDDEWRDVLDVNLRGAWLGCQTVLPAMRERGGGAIVNLSSESRSGAFGQANYASAKAGVVGLTKTVAVEAARFRVRCNAIAPGTIDTPMVQAVPEDIRASWLPRIPLARLGAAEEVASAIVFLVSDASSYITGQVLQVDGGSSL